MNRLRVQNRASRPAGRAAALIAAASLVVLVAGGLLVGIFYLGWGADFRGGALLFPDTGSGPQFAFLDDGGASTGGRIAFLTGTGLPRVAWRSAARLKQSTYLMPVAIADKEAIYVPDKDRLLGIARLDGHTLWTADLPDKIACSDHCLALAGGHVILSTADGTLQAVNIANGAVDWHYQADQPPQFTAAGGTVASFNHQGTLLLFDAGSGQMTQLQPTCGGATGIVDLTPDYAGGALYVWGYTCLLKLDLATQKPVWSVELPMAGTHSAISVYTKEELFASLSGSSSGRQLVAVDLASGQARTIATDKDYDLLPRFVQGRTLIARAVRTRGTAKYEIWGLDIASGKMLWRYSLEDSKPTDDAFAGPFVDSTNPLWTDQLADGRLYILSYAEAPGWLGQYTPQATITALDPATGTVASQQTINLPHLSGKFYDTPRVLRWNGSQGYLVVGAALEGIDLASGSLDYHWP